MDKEVNITMKFDGSSHEVDIDTYANVLLSYSRIINETSTTIGTAVKPRIKVKSNTDGSLDVALAVSAIHSLLSNFGIDDLVKIVSVVGGVFEIYSVISRSKNTPQVITEGNSVNITVNGDIYTYDKVEFEIATKNQEVIKNSNKIFDHLENNSDVSGFGISYDSKDRAPFYASRDTFGSIISSIDILEDESDTKKEIERVTLSVVKPNLSQSTSNRWSFIYHGVQIGAVIKDEDYLANTLPNDPFLMNDTLDVDLEICKVLNEGVWVNKSYAVVKIYEHLSSAETEEMF